MKDRIDAEGLRLPIKVDATSNGEFRPVPLTEHVVKANALAAERIGEHPVALVVWAPVAKERRVAGGAVMEIQVHGAARLVLPENLFPAEFQMFLEGATPGSRGREVPFRREGGNVLVEALPELSGRWIYVVPAGQATIDN